MEFRSVFSPEGQKPDLTRMLPSCWLRPHPRDIRALARPWPVPADVGCYGVTPHAAWKRVACKYCAKLRSSREQGKKEGGADVFLFPSRPQLPSDPFCPTPPSPIWLHLVPAHKRGGTGICLIRNRPQTCTRTSPFTTFRSLQLADYCLCVGTGSSPLPLSLMQLNATLSKRGNGEVEGGARGAGLMRPNLLDFP